MLELYSLLPNILKTLDANASESGVQTPLPTLGLTPSNAIGVDILFKSNEAGLELVPGNLYYIEYSYKINGTWGNIVYDKINLARGSYTYITLPPLPPNTTPTQNIFYRLSIYSDSFYRDLISSQDSSVSTTGWYSITKADIEKVMSAFSQSFSTINNSIAGLANNNNPNELTGTQLRLLSSNFGQLTYNGFPTNYQQFLVSVLSQFIKSFGTVHGLYQFFSYWQYPQQIYTLKELYKTTAHETINYSSTDTGSYTIKSARYEMFGPFANNAVATANLPDNEALSFQQAVTIYKAIADRLPAHVYPKPPAFILTINDAMPLLSDSFVNIDYRTIDETPLALGDSVNIAISATPVPCYPNGTSFCDSVSDTNGSLDLQTQNLKESIRDILLSLNAIYPCYVESISPATTSGGAHTYVTGYPAYPSSQITLPLTSSSYWLLVSGSYPINLNFIKYGTGVLSLSGRTSCTLSAAVQDQDTVFCLASVGSVITEPQTTATITSNQIVSGELAYQPHPMSIFLVAYLPPFGSTLTVAANQNTGQLVVAATSGSYNGYNSGFLVGQTVQIYDPTTGNIEYRVIVSIDVTTMSVYVGCGLEENFTAGSTVIQLGKSLVASTNYIYTPTSVTNMYASVKGDVDPTYNNPSLPAGTNNTNYFNYKNTFDYVVKFSEPLLPYTEIIAYYLKESDCVYTMVDPLYTERNAIPVTLSQTGGSNGTQTTTASYTYTATDLNGNVIGTGLSPAVPRTVGAVTPATYGTVYFNSSNTLVLQVAYEVPTTSGC